MTSFLALRASVCAYLWCLIPPVCYIGFPNRSSSLSLASLPFDNPEWPLRFELGKLTLLYIFSHLSGLNFALGASYGFEPTFSARRPVRWLFSFFNEGVEKTPQTSHTPDKPGTLCITASCSRCYASRISRVDVLR